MGGPYGILLRHCSALVTIISSNIVFYLFRSKNRLEEKLFFSFVFFVLAQKKRLTFILEKPFFMQVNPVFIETAFCCVCSLKTNPVFLQSKPFFI